MSRLGSFVGKRAISIRDGRSSGRGRSPASPAFPCPYFPDPHHPTLASRTALTMHRPSARSVMKKLLRGNTLSGLSPVSRAVKEPC